MKKWYLFYSSSDMFSELAHTMEDSIDLNSLKLQQVGAEISENQKLHQASPYITTKPEATALIYGESLSASTLSEGAVQYSSEDETKVEGSFVWKDATVRPVVADSGKTFYKVEFKSENENYDTVETEITLTVNKAANPQNMPSATMKTGWVQYKGNWYYLDASGAMVTDTVVEGYRIGHDGVWVK